MPPASNHKVSNQPPHLSGQNAFRANPLLLQIASGFGQDQLKEFDQIGHYCLSTEAQDLARFANANPPQLVTHDRFGNRVDKVEFHPSYHALMRRSVSYGLSSSVWEDTARGNGDGHLKRAVRYFMMAGLETGHLTSLSTTNAAVASLMTAPHLAKEWVPRVTTRKYDSANKSPIQKSCLTIGVAITEKQAGTDLSALTSRAEAVGNGLFRITGHKWFLSSPMADAFLVLARTAKGSSCFLVPRYLAAEEHNRIHLFGLKDKLGNRSSATAEIELNGAIAQMIGREGEGAKVIKEMQLLTRLDSTIASSGIMHASLSEAVHHARNRKVDGGLLFNQPLMHNVLADMAIDVAGATALSLRLARAYDSAKTIDEEGAFSYAMTPVVKYWTNKIAPALIGEAMEVVGGNSYIETSVLPRHYREAPNLSIGEGTGNMMALEACRLFQRSPALFDTVVTGLAEDLGARGPQMVKLLNAAFTLSQADEGAARMLTEQLALAAAGAELMRLGTGTLAETFLETRLGGSWRSTYGMLPNSADAKAIIDALYPPAS